MPESHTNEYKEIWRDDYVRTVAACATTQGGVIDVGRADEGRVVGIVGIEKLLEDLPNKSVQFSGFAKYC